MLLPIYEKRFAKEVQKAQKRGKDMQKLKDIMTMLIHEKPLAIKNRNHKLKGDFVNYWECHIEPDWLLIYKLTAKEIIFARTGTHADLFE
jgi:mRNA interferase YafQ